MKLLNKFIRLLALISLSLSITPLTTVKASDDIQVKDTTKSSSNLAVTYSDTDASDTPVATASATPTTTTDDGTSQTATSNVSVTVLSGILTLAAVPDFNFGTMTVGSTSKLQNNTADATDFNTDSTNGDVTAGQDGNDSSLLEVIDSRNFTSEMPGFTLTASIGQLTNADASKKLDAILNLSSIPLLNDSDENISNSSTYLKTNAIQISNDSSSNKNSTLIDLQRDSYNAGVIKAKFNTPSSASLTIPNQTGSTSEESTNHMNAVVTWTLTAKPSVQSNLQK
ncbi:hypothetical protein FHL06_02975 [Lactobacillus halodurans]|uniref:WxL domain-containing protein n=1 Tax=Companilactobacillus halodurans TaxID=2584183 RepID=A0A5P0ZMB6_9LACO|nr:WxL domain-containing protein [Companilactobacillus halodurans]MQS75357.1 hypothetical protein [Companilactobacillus halodurans]